VLPNAKKPVLGRAFFVAEAHSVLFFSLLFQTLLLESASGQAGKEAHSSPEHYAFSGAHEAGKNSKDANGSAEKESPENKTAHKEPHGRFFSRRIKKEVFFIIYGRSLFCQ
jgi:hypothetical protein